MKTKKILFSVLFLLLSMTLGAEQAETLTERLQGNVAGVKVTSLDGSIEGRSNINIRGVNSIRLSSSPLIVVDGIYINAYCDGNLNSYWAAGDGFRLSPINSMSFLNPNDIKDVKVLKNISETAAYGSEGANGVIIITTRNSESDQVKVEWNSDVSVLVPESRSDIFGASVSHEHTLNISKSAGGAKYYLSGWYNDLNGFGPSSSTYGGLRANFETTANKYVNFGLNSNISLGRISSMAGSSWAGAPSYTMAVRNPDLFLNDSQEGWLKDHDDDSKEKRALLTTWIKIKFSPSLSLNTSLGADYSRSSRYIWYGNGISYGADNNGAASIITSDLLRYRINSTLHFARYFSDHHLVADLGFESTGLWSRYSTQNGSNFFNHSLRAFGMNYASTKYRIHEFDNRYGRLGVFADVAYDWNGVVGVHGIYRADWLSLYSSSPDVYPSGNIWLDLHKILMPSVRSISSLKISAGYGRAGYDEALPYEVIHKYIPSGIPSVPAGAENYHNALLRLETRELNASVNVGFIDERLQFGISYYDRLTDDYMTLNSSGAVEDFYWHSAPLSELQSRMSRISNKGFEFEASADIFRRKNLVWTVSANLSYNINQLYEVHEYDADGMRFNTSDVANRNVLGHQVGALYGYEYSNGRFVDQTGNGIINTNDRVVIGNPIPVYVGGLSSSFRYRDFGFNVVIDGAAGHDILNLSSMYSDDDPIDVISDKYIEKGDFLRLKKLSLSYCIPLKTNKIEPLKMLLTGMNLITLTGYSGWNPDVNVYGTSPMSSGIDYGAWPQGRVVSLGLSVDF
jgi:TonB-dependent SusC/RagA subfamily outer membrane receptor